MLIVSLREINVVTVYTLSKGFPAWDTRTSSGMEEKSRERSIVCFMASMYFYIVYFISVMSTLPDKGILN